MKRLLILLMIAAVTLFATACGKSSDDTPKEPTAEPSTQLHTIPPAETDQLEWAPVDCEISLENSAAVYAESKDFLTFALSGTTDEDCELRFVINDETAKMLKSQQSDSAYYLTVNGKVLKGDVSFSDDYTEITMKGGYTYAEMCALATEIRGL